MLSFFYGYKFFSFTSVYKPKHDTEHIILLYQQIDKKALDVLEIGTGTGCISITLKLLDNSINSYVVDNNYLSICNVRHNAYYHGVNLDIIYSDFLLSFSKGIYKKKYDVVISNIPYLNIEEFLCKHNGIITQKHVHDYYNCVGGVYFANLMLFAIDAQYFLFEMNIEQMQVIDQTYYSIVKSIVPFRGSKIVFVLLEKRARIV